MAISKWSPTEKARYCTIDRVQRSSSHPVAEQSWYTNSFSWTAFCPAGTLLPTQHSHIVPAGLLLVCQGGHHGALKGASLLQVTHLFRDALHGWGQVVLSVNVSPCAKDYDETSHVLKVCWRGILIYFAFPSCW